MFSDEVIPIRLCGHADPAHETTCYRLSGHQGEHQFSDMPRPKVTPTMAVNAIANAAIEVHMSRKLIAHLRKVSEKDYLRDETMLLLREYDAMRAEAEGE